MTTPPTILVTPETRAMLFADCPFCLHPMPLDAATGAMDCQECAVHLELAPDAEPVPLPAAA